LFTFAATPSAYSMLVFGKPDPFALASRAAGLDDQTCKLPDT